MERGNDSGPTGTEQGSTLASAGTVPRGDPSDPIRDSDLESDTDDSVMDLGLATVEETLPVAFPKDAQDREEDGEALEGRSLRIMSLPIPISLNNPH